MYQIYYQKHDPVFVQAAEKVRNGSSKYLNLPSDMQREKIQTLWGNIQSVMYCEIERRSLPTDIPDLCYREIITSEPSCELLVVYFIQLNMAELWTMHNKYDSLNNEIKIKSLNITLPLK